MKFLKKIVAWIAHKLSKEQKAELFDKAVDKWAGEKKERTVIGPREQIVNKGDTFIDPGTGSRLGRGKKKP